MIRINNIILLIFIVLAVVGCSRPLDNGPCRKDGFVYVDDASFALDGEPWFPKMLNYKAELKPTANPESKPTADGLEVFPAPWYTGNNIRSHFDTIASWGFNAVRLCLDGDYRGYDTAAMYAATRRAVLQADSAGLHVMLLLHPPIDTYWREYDAGLMRSLADLPALWAYDLMNEPLYFDPVKERNKRSAVKLVRQWRELVRSNAPHQLFTVALAEPIEVFGWDPSMLPVDFVEMHTYHPLRVQSEMWWYSHHCGRPWMVGETGLPADGDSVPYDEQAMFMWETYRYAVINGACGYGWWEFQDCPEGVNFEARHTGLRDSNGLRKPAADIVHLLDNTRLGLGRDDECRPPVNYSNMLAYSNVAVSGTVVDKEGNPIEGAVIRGWNEDWSVGVNTFADDEGRFRLVSNDICTHFRISAPGYSCRKTDWHPRYPADVALPDREREYQQIPLLGWGDSLNILPISDDGRYAAAGAIEATIGDIVLRKL